MSSSPRSASVPPPSTSVSFVRQQTPSTQHRLPLPSSRLLSTASASELRSATLSSRSPMMPGLSSRHSASMSMLPVSRGSRLTFSDDADEALAPSYLSFRRTGRPLRSASQTGKMKARRSYLDDIEEEDAASREQVRDLRMRASKAKEYLDQHRQVLDRLRTLQMNGPTAPVVSVTASPFTSSLPPPRTTTSSVRRENTREYLPTKMPTISAVRSEMMVSPARRALRELLGRGRTSQRQSYA